ncbi:hypothetical protein AN958_03916 [Leucoagaricus sp. SymC.cos]|nr:hypothetical protein AN958_03916 [Leucoagaricus sp. SymC.cos]
MIVSFPFTFSFNVPGLPNPFSPNYSQTGPSLTRQPSGEPGTPTGSENGIQNQESSMAIAGGRLASSPAPSFSSTSRPKNLKRGWEPAFAESTQSSATLVSTSGYLNPPSKYGEFVNAPSMHDQPEEELPPPCKKRRGLAGSIVSTAVNAALIGTAVGLTVYRLWRGRGKEPPVITAAVPASPDSESGSSQQLPPPPPYQEREWTPVSYPTPPSESAPSPPLLLAPTPRRKVVRHTVKRSRRPRVSRPQTAPSPGRAGPSAHHSQSEFDFGRDDEAGGDDQMDWIGDKLAQLIEEGKRALSREVVVMSDAKEDEVDDGSGAWEEEDHLTSSSVGRQRFIPLTFSSTTIHYPTYHPETITYKSFFS